MKKIHSDSRMLHVKTKPSPGGRGGIIDHHFNPGPTQTHEMFLGLWAPQRKGRVQKEGREGKRTSNTFGVDDRKIESELWITETRRKAVCQKPGEAKTPNEEVGKLGGKGSNKRQAGGIGVNALVVGLVCGGEVNAKMKERIESEVEGPAGNLEEKLKIKGVKSR